MGSYFDVGLDLGRAVLGYGLDIQNEISLNQSLQGTVIGLKFCDIRIDLTSILIEPNQLCENYPHIYTYISIET